MELFDTEIISEISKKLTMGPYLLCLAFMSPRTSSEKWASRSCPCSFAQAQRAPATKADAERRGAPEHELLPLQALLRKGTERVGAATVSKEYLSVDVLDTQLTTIDAAPSADRRNRTDWPPRLGSSSLNPGHLLKVYK